MNRYERYKDSGIPWLGKVPEHWEVKRLRFTVNLNPVKSELDIPEDTLVSFIPMEAVNFDKNLTLTEERNLDEVYKGYTYFKNGDVVLAKITPCFENGKSAIAQNLTNGIAFGTTELHVLRSQDSINNHFLYYLIKSDSFMKIGESEMYGAGGQKRVPEEFIKNFLIGLPPYYEQTAIAHYLDTKLGEIDVLIDKQQTLLEKLAEQRTAVITRAVTKGLNPAAPMKNSGVEWLGDVPVHWDIERLKFIASVNKGKMPKELVSENFDDFPTYLSMDYLRNGIATHFVVDRTVPVIDENEILLLWDGANAGEFIKSKKGVISSTIALIKFQDRIYKNFAWYACLVIERILRASTIGMGIPHVNGEELKNSPIVLPPVKEQTAIAEYLDQETSKIDRLCETVNQTIGRLKEYRTALITQAVTGKIKVTDE